MFLGPALKIEELKLAWYSCWSQQITSHPIGLSGFSAPYTWDGTDISALFLLAKIQSTSLQIVQKEEEIFKTLFTALKHNPEQCVSMSLEWFSSFLILFVLGPSTRVFSKVQPNYQVSSFRCLWRAAAVRCRSLTAWCLVVAHGLLQAALRFHNLAVLYPSVVCTWASLCQTKNTLCPKELTVRNQYWFFPSAAWVTWWENMKSHALLFTYSSAVKCSVQRHIL